MPDRNHILKSISYVSSKINLLTYCGILSRKSFFNPKTSIMFFWIFCLLKLKNHMSDDETEGSSYI